MSDLEEVMCLLFSACWEQESLRHSSYKIIPWIILSNLFFTQKKHKCEKHQDKTDCFIHCTNHTTSDLYSVRYSLEAETVGFYKMSIILLLLSKLMEEKI